MQQSVFRQTTASHHRVGSTTNHLYDGVGGAFLATNVTGSATLTIPPDQAIVLVQCPATGALSQVSQKLLVAGVVVDYSNARLDTDGDGLPDWWESRYYGNITNALPQGVAANGFNNLQCYRLGLDPTNPFSREIQNMFARLYEILRFFDLLI